MMGLTNWLSQIVSVSFYSLRTIPQRLGSSAASLVGIAGVVAVLVGVLSIAQGVSHMMESSAGQSNAVVLRSGANTEMMSGLSGDNVKIIMEAPGIARSEHGPVASSELFVIIDRPKRSTGTDANVPLRGVVPAAFEVRDTFEIVEGRMFEWGLNEVVVGSGAADQFTGLDVGSM